ncbi:MAG: hypothetical protein F2840_16605 [Actinobacteria bacterium]|nr:hypothetical protein [Actinomycetota bacterium]
MQHGRIPSNDQFSGGLNAIVKRFEDLGFAVERKASTAGRPTSTGKPSIFGHIPDYPVGSLFDDRMAVKSAGLHRHEVDEISGRPSDGADAIVLNGGYREDFDEGDYVLYTGQGGRKNGATHQTEDQTLTRGNLALVKSETDGLPVRVIRGHRGAEGLSPASGYRYDGLYRVERHFHQRSTDGPFIYRFELRHIEDDDPSVKPFSVTDEPPDGDEAPARAHGTTQRIVRNTQVTQWVKDLYDGRCQICGVSLLTPTGVYSEGAHVRPLGRPHDGADMVSNVLCLCPNCHVLLDKGAIRVDPETFMVLDVLTGSEVGVLRLAAGHPLDAKFIDYHSTHIADQPMRQPGA